MIMTELKKSTFSKYSTALVSFITCLIDGHDDMPKEHDTLILNEFIGNFIIVSQTYVTCVKANYYLLITAL